MKNPALVSAFQAGRQGRIWVTAGGPGWPLQAHLQLQRGTPGDCGGVPGERSLAAARRRERTCGMARLRWLQAQGNMPRWQAGVAR